MVSHSSLVNVDVVEVKCLSQCLSIRKDACRGEMHLHWEHEFQKHPELGGGNALQLSDILATTFVRTYEKAILLRK